MPGEKEVVNSDAPGQSSAETEAESTPANTDESIQVDKGGESTEKGQSIKEPPFHEHPRFKEIVSQKNELKKQVEEERKGREEITQRLVEMENRFNPPKEEEPIDIFTNPEKFVERVFEKKESAYKERIAALESKLSNDSVLKTEDEILGGFEKNPVLQKVFKDKAEYKEKILETLQKHGYKEKFLTEEAIRSANTLLMQEKQGDIINAAMELGRESERLNRTDVDETGSDFSNRGKPTPKAAKDKMTSEQRRAALKMGLNPDDIEKDEVVRYQDSNGKITTVISEK